MLLPCLDEDESLYKRFFFPNITFDPLKTSGNLWFSDIFRGIKIEPREEKV